MDDSLKLSCNAPGCNAELADDAVVALCNHALCLPCANHHGFNSAGPYTCPICQQPLDENEVHSQHLRRSEEWKSIILSGLDPTIIMECAGRAISFWAYQMTCNLSKQMQRNSDLEKDCSRLAKDVQDLWDQGNARITSLSQKVKESELREQGLLRKSEELRHQLTEKTAKCDEACRLYDKLKDAIKIKESQGWGPLFDRPVAAASPKSMAMNTMAPVLHTGGYSRYSTISGRGQPVSNKEPAPSYFLESPSRSKPQKFGPDFVALARTVASKAGAVRPQFSHQAGRVDGGPASSKPASQLAGGFRSNPVADRADTLTPLENRHGLRRTAFLGDDMVGGTRDIPSSRAHITIGPTMGVAGLRRPTPLSADMTQRPSGARLFDSLPDMTRKL